MPFKKIFRQKWLVKTVEICLKKKKPTPSKDGTTRLLVSGQNPECFDFFLRFMEQL